jgi:hypothetical protein
MTVTHVRCVPAGGRVCAAGRSVTRRLAGVGAGRGGAKQRGGLECGGSCERVAWGGEVPEGQGAG